MAMAGKNFSMGGIQPFFWMQNILEFILNMMFMIFPKISNSELE